MSRLTISDLDLGLANLFDQRKPDLDLSAAGKLFGPMIAKKYAAIQSLPEAMRGRKPLVEELGEADAEYDDLGTAITSYLDAVDVAPGLSDDTRAAAKRIRLAFIPSKTMLTDSYAEEAAAAKKNRAKLVERADDLTLFPTPESQTLYQWVERFLDAGDRLAALLDLRSLVPVSAAGSAGKLRGETIGLLHQFRTTLRTELADNPDLPRDLEARVFSYLDELHDRRRPSPKPKGEEKP
ncbi:hypothetical protein [Polyangium spumosum]|uniref:Uncharacterized protein n=1 Tax=Polyangium spumosum TaxID=889282 RepID=A0A6N7PFE0_9BACT|nr:hypothetical protein [Polyangium spumosum]MRG90709.1 hypothetical protein [Polyangium spumosum]